MLESDKAIVLIGAPAAGKGTVAALFEKQGFTIISSGTILREEVAKKTKLGQEIGVVMHAGRLVPDEVIISMMRNKIAETSSRRFIFDGFPRSFIEAQALDKILKNHGFDTDGIHVFKLNVDDGNLRLRSQKRRNDDIAAAKPPRTDGNPEVFEKRLAAYKEYSLDVGAYYGDRVCQIDANQNPQNTLAQIQKFLVGCTRQSTKPEANLHDITL